MDLQIAILSFLQNRENKRIARNLATWKQLLTAHSVDRNNESTWTSLISRISWNISTGKKKLGLNFYYVKFWAITTFKTLKKKNLKNSSYCSMAIPQMKFSQNLYLYDNLHDLHSAFTKNWETREVNYCCKALSLTGFRDPE